MQTMAQLLRLHSCNLISACMADLKCDEFEFITWAMHLILRYSSWLTGAWYSVNSGPFLTTSTFLANFKMFLTLQEERMYYWKSVQVNCFVHLATAFWWAAYCVCSCVCWCELNAWKPSQDAIYCFLFALFLICWIPNLIAVYHRIMTWQFRVKIMFSPSI